MVTLCAEASDAARENAQQEALSVRNAAEAAGALCVARVL